MLSIIQRTVKDTQPRRLPKFKVGSWIHAGNPTEEELRHLAKALKLELGHLKDGLDVYEVPRLEVERGTIYVFTRVPYRKNGDIVTYPLLLILAPHHIVTVSLVTPPFLEKFLNGTTSFYTTQKTKLCLQIFSEITTCYNIFLAEIGKGIRKTRANIEQLTTEEIARFVLLEEILNDFLSALVPTNAILQTLLSGKYLRLYEEDKNLVEDLSLSHGQLIEACKSHLKTIVNIREAYSTIMTHQLNRVIKLLTALTIVSAIPTIIASFYGMNVALPLAEHPSAFWIVLSIAIFLSLVILVIFARNRWL
ncbi:magnesium transporter CorA family protein [Candidatus Parcubacteria bacterium]|nr:MAG: magnesium transporter CorA family protein [Candidatus Parcubacteria bacterium]